MQQVRTNIQAAFSNVRTWFGLTYSELKIDTYVVFGTIALVILLMCASAYQEAVEQARVFLGMPLEERSTLMQVVNFVNQYGLAALIGICYFSNVSQGGKRRELVIDLLCVALGVMLPQLVFHASWLYVTHDLIATNTLTINHAGVTAIALEWLIVYGITLLLALLAIPSWRVLRRGASLHNQVDTQPKKSGARS